jgi:two-component system response regulator AtoC
MPSAAVSVLVVDDEPAVGRILQALLRQAGMEAEYVSSGAAALEALARRPHDAVVSDLYMGEMDGLGLLQRVRAQWPDLPVVLMSGQGTVALAVEAMRLGATDFVLKPCDRDEVLFAVQKALAAGRAAAERPPAATLAGGAFVGGSDAMAEVSALLARAAQGTATVLIRGESGTGKELAARAIHEGSPRRGKPFVVLHCAALPDNLLESEIFGYEKGAFTGANVSKPGRVELAHGGTLFLDEIGDITPATQVKLLRLLQEKTIERLGGTRSQKIDVRFVAATHRNLEELVAQGTFREDLFYRLSVVPVWMPPLRTRPTDIAPLATHFCAVHGVANGRPQATLTPDAVAALQSHPWPGNIRQLQNFIERLVVLAPQDVITGADVARELGRGPGGEGGRLSPDASRAGPSGPPSPAAEEGPQTLDGRRREAEREALQVALQRANNNRTLAARLLGVSRRTLYNKLEEHGLV